MLNNEAQTDFEKLIGLWVVKHNLSPLAAAETLQRMSLAYVMVAARKDAEEKAKKN